MNVGFFRSIQLISIFSVLFFSPFCVTTDNIYYRSHVLFSLMISYSRFFIPQNRYDMCRRRKGGRCTKGTAGMVYYIAITLYSFFFFFFFLIFVTYSIFASLYIVDGIVEGTRSNGI